MIARARTEAIRLVVEHVIATGVLDHEVDETSEVPAQGNEAQLAERWRRLARGRLGVAREQARERAGGAPRTSPPPGTRTRARSCARAARRWRGSGARRRPRAARFEGVQHLPLTAADIHAGSRAESASALSRRVAAQARQLMKVGVLVDRVDEWPKLAPAGELLPCHALARRSFRLGLHGRARSPRS